MTTTIDRYAELCTRAENHRRMVDARIRRIAREAGIDPSIWSIHSHNAMVAYHRGQPWAGVNYSLVRKIRWLEQERLFAAQRIVTRWFERQPCPLACGDCAMCRRAEENRHTA